MTVRQHLEYFLWWHQSNKKKFKTHDIQNLSNRGIIKFGKRLGSPDTYTRAFRKMREEKVYNIMIYHENKNFRQLCRFLQFFDGLRNSKFRSIFSSFCG